MHFFSTLIFCFFISTMASASWRLGLGVGYSPNYLVNLTGSGTSSGVPYSVTYSFEYSANFNLHLDLWNLHPNSWGFISGLQLDSQRTINKLVIDGINFPVTSTSSKYQTHFIYLGSAYRWNSFYIPVGITYGITLFTPASGSNVASSTENGIGGLLGAGWFLNENFVVEYIGRSTTTALKFVSGNDVENNSGTIGSAVLNIKYFF